MWKRKWQAGCGTGGGGRAGGLGIWFWFMQGARRALNETRARAIYPAPAPLKQKGNLPSYTTTMFRRRRIELGRGAAV